MKNQTTHGLRATLAAAGVLAAAGLAALPAQAATGDATVTVVHGIPDTAVDVYVDGNRALSNFEFETVTDPISLPAGSHEIEVRPAGAAASSDPILELSPDLPAGANATVVAHLTAEGEPAIKPFINPTEAVPDGMGRLVVRHTAAAPAVDVLAGGEAVISDLSNPDEKMLMVPEGTVSASVAAAGTTDPVIGPVDLPVQSGQTLVVYAIGSLEGDTLTAVTQAYGSGGSAAPSTVNAGTGGQADGGPSAPLVVLTALAGAALVVAGSRRLAGASAKR
ncbi:DUF4397 domain-containing protein [Knoellia sp. 3-2P3]|uniref:DUF4397 domain-containing protein n=1 Tax=unclassified Knoellia TaxID=2618719 RepID=UPI0023DBAE4A|nr:DUF4397 domain-containing protein [Knoellia sp. 3-2P3]MDF2090785.1 DUF4397 domain-containing protein [Knoellia sp. 3-2P3]